MPAYQEGQCCIAVKRGSGYDKGWKRGPGGGSGVKGHGSLWSQQEDMLCYLVDVGVAGAQLHGPRETPAASMTTLGDTADATAQVGTVELGSKGCPCPCMIYVTVAQWQDRLPRWCDKGQQILLRPHSGPQISECCQLHVCS